MTVKLTPSHSDADSAFHCNSALGQVFTDAWVADEMVSVGGIELAKISSKYRVLDPACGDGKLLLSLVRGIMFTLPREKWAAAFEGIHGWDIDPLAIESCRKNLASATGRQTWDLKCCDALRAGEEGLPFEWCIANPPYIRIHNMDAVLRAFLRSTFPSCKSGMFDIYIAFIEKIAHLANRAIIICPASVRTSQASKSLRRQLVAGARICEVYDHGHKQRFADASVNTAYLVLGKNKTNTLAVYPPESPLPYICPFRHISGGEPWVTADIGRDTLTTRLRDICRISVGIATLADKVFIFPVSGDTGSGAMLVKTVAGFREIERELLKPIIKASVSSNNKRLAILCPYEVAANGEHRIIPEQSLMRLYPLAYSYLLEMRARLDTRDKGKKNPVAWYAFGRTQGLNTVHRQKLVFSPMADSGAPYYCAADAGTYYYSGYAAFPMPNMTLADIETVLTSDEFKAHLEVHCRKLSGTWTSCSKTEIQDMAVDGIVDLSVLVREPAKRFQRQQVKK